MELEYVLDHSHAVALVMLDSFLGADYQALLTEIVPEVAPRPLGQIGAARLPALRELIVLGQPALAAARGFAEALALGQSLAPAVVHTASTRVQPTDILYVLYTSGSTARPKGVTLCEVIAARLRASAAPLTHREGSGCTDLGKEE